MNDKVDFVGLWNSLLSAKIIHQVNLCEILSPLIPPKTQVNCVPYPVVNYVCRSTVRIYRARAQRSLLRFTD